MSVVAFGNPTWQQLTYPEWNSDGFGVDTCRVRYNGLASLKESFLNGIAKWQTMPPYVGPSNAYIPAYPGMSLESWSDSMGTANIYNLDLHYKGFRNGQIPIAKSVSGYTYTSAQGQGSDVGNIDPETGNAAIVSGTIFYLAARTTWTWFETSTPSPAPRYNTVVNAMNPFSTIIRYSLTTTNPQTGVSGEPLNNIDLTAFTSILNSLSPQNVVTEYEQELIIPGRLWACRSVVDWRFA